MKKQDNSSSNGKQSSPIPQKQVSANPLSKAQEWIELIYSNSIPMNVNWSKRVEEATAKLSFCPSSEEIRTLSREYFLQNRKFETYWSMMIMKHNVCNSLREIEESGEGNANENTSYKAKLENAMRLTSLEQEIERRETELFKGNEDIKESMMREVGKHKSKYEGASLHDQLIGGKKSELWTD